jgi:hypothetical protein
MVDLGAGVAQRLAEIDLAAGVAGHVLDQQHALALGQMAFDLRIASESLGLLAHVEHRQGEPVGDPGGERDAGGLAARDRVELLEACVTHEGGGGEIDQRLTHAREGDQASAVGVDRARPARREDERLVAHKADRLDLEQHLGRELGHHFLVGKAKS